MTRGSWLGRGGVALGLLWWRHKSAQAAAAAVPPPSPLPASPPLPLPTAPPPPTELMLDWHKFGYDKGFAAAQNERKAGTAYHSSPALAAADLSAVKDPVAYSAGYADGWETGWVGPIMTPATTPVMADWRQAGYDKGYAQGQADKKAGGLHAASPAPAAADLASAADPVLFSTGYAQGYEIGWGAPLISGYGYDNPYLYGLVGAGVIRRRSSSVPMMAAPMVAPRGTSRVSVPDYDAGYSQGLKSCTSDLYSGGWDPGDMDMSPGWKAGYDAGCKAGRRR